MRILLFVLLSIVTNLSLHAQRLQWQEVLIASSGTVHGLTSMGQDILLAATANGVYRSFDSGTTWLQSSQGLATTNILSIGTLGNLVFCGTGTQRALYLSADTAKTWKKMEDGLVAKFVSLGAILFVQFGTTIYQSRDSGKSFQRLQIDSIFCSKIFTQNNILYANGATSKRDNFGNYFVTSFLFQSLDSGKSWKRIIERPFPWFPSNFLHIDSLMFFTQEPFQEAPGTLHRAKFADTTWSLLSINGQETKDIRAMISIQKRIYIFDVFLGLYSSDTFGETWQLDSKGLPPSAFITQLVHVNNYIYAVGSAPGKGGIIYRASVAPLTSVREESKPPLASPCFLDNSYPNPAQDASTLRWHIPTDTEVSLTVYDMLRRPVLKPLVLTKISAGTHETMLNVRHLPSGNYIIILRAGEHLCTKIISIVH